MRSPCLRASVMASKIVFTTISVSFFETCGVSSATFSINPLFVITRSRGTAGRASQARPARSFAGVLLGQLLLQQIAEGHGLGGRLLRRQPLQRLALLAVGEGADRERDLLVV